MKKSIKTALVFVGGFAAGGFAHLVLTKAMIYKYMLDNFECDEHCRRSKSRKDKPFYSMRVEDLLFDTRVNAEDALNNMRSCIHKYGVVSVAEYYDMNGMSYNHDHTQYGWVKLDSAQVHRVRDGYIIELPRAIRID